MNEFAAGFLIGLALAPWINPLLRELLYKIRG